LPVNISQVSVATMQMTIIIAYLKVTLAIKTIDVTIINAAIIAIIIVRIRILDALL
jgi:hypothetical protein